MPRPDAASVTRTRSVTPERAEQTANIRASQILHSTLRVALMTLAIGALTGSSGCTRAGENEARGSRPHSTGDTIIPPPGVAGDSIGQPPPSRTTVHDSNVYGKDSLVGVLHVAGEVAYIQDGATTIRLIQADAVVPTGSQALMADAARALRNLDAHVVWARGELKGDIMWGATVKEVTNAP